MASEWVGQQYFDVMQSPEITNLQRLLYCWCMLLWVLFCFPFTVEIQLMLDIISRSINFSTESTEQLVFPLIVLLACAYKAQVSQ